MQEEKGLQICSYELPASHAGVTPSITSSNASESASGWRSINDFIEAYYNEPHKVCINLKPTLHSRILGVWTPGTSQAARDELNMTITRNAADIMVKESIRAARHITILV